MAVPKIGLIVVGDEILSGLRQDKHIPAVIERLTARGLHLSWVQMVGDDREFLTATLKRSFASDHIVLSCGGIGGTPDDHTRQAAAQALGLPIVRHEGAVELIRQRCEESGQPLDEFRLRMADFPEGASLIPNPYNRIAGFTIGQHHFVPGFPVMAWPMVAWVLDTLHADLHGRGRLVERSVVVHGAIESRLTPLMLDIEARFAPVKVFSLPSVDHPVHGRHIELGVKGRAQEVDEAFAALRDGLVNFGASMGPESVRD